MDDLKGELIGFGKEIAIALIILGIILGSLYAYSGRWPPMVVVESSSMSHSPESQIGIIDTGDIVLVRERERTDIKTYVEGRVSDHEKYGQYGDVIIYRPMGDPDTTPIIHRAVVFLELNETDGDHSFDAPSLRHLEYGVDWETSHGERWLNLTGTITIFDYGFRDIDLEINLRPLLENEERRNSGYITMGDKNQNYDQASRICPSPVMDEWIIGKARGQLPWFGILKLMYMRNTGEVPTNSWYNLGISITILVVGPFVVEELYRRWKKKDDDGEDADLEDADVVRNDDLEEYDGVEDADLEDADLEDADLERGDDGGESKDEDKQRKKRMMKKRF